MKSQYVNEPEPDTWSYSHFRYIFISLYLFKFYSISFCFISYYCLYKAWNSYEYKTGGEFIQGQDCEITRERLKSIWILVLLIIKCWELTAALRRYHFCYFAQSVGQPWLTKTEDKLLQTITARQTNLNQNCIQFIYPCIQGWTIIQTPVTR